jgi:hypothetical protein
MRLCTVHYVDVKPARTPLVGLDIFKGMDAEYGHR